MDAVSIAGARFSNCRNIPISLTNPIPNCLAVEYRPEKDQSGKSECVTGNALPRVRDTTRSILDVAPYNTDWPEGPFKVVPALEGYAP